MLSLPLYPRCSGDLFQFGGVTLVAIAPCCPVYHRLTQHKSGRQTLSIVPAKFWGKVAQLTEQAFEVSNYRHLPVFRYYPTWVVAEYHGGSPMGYLKNARSYELTLWQVKHCPNALRYRPLLLPVPNQVPSQQQKEAA